MVSDAAILDDINVDAEINALRANMQSEGLGMTDLKAQNNDADTWVTLYHAFEGRAVQVPFYMVDPKEGHSRLKETFDEETVRINQLDPKWVGKRIWYTQPQPSVNTDGNFLCPFSVLNDEEYKETLRKEGFIADCRKDKRWSTRYEVDNHVQKRHPKRFAARERYDNEQREQARVGREQANVEALTELVQALLQEKRGPGRPKKENNG